LHDSGTYLLFTHAMREVGVSHVFAFSVHALPAEGLHAAIKTMMTETVESAMARLMARQSNF